MTKIAIDVGHNCYPDIGAYGIRAEDVLVKEIGERLIYDLEQEGLDIIRVHPSKASSVTNSLHQRCMNANVADADYFISIHFNASNGRGKGTECYAVSQPGRQLAKHIVDEIAKLGFINRGVKNGQKYYVIQNTSMPAVIIECAFCDNKDDMTLYDTDLMCRAIFDGTMKFLNKQE